jgi:hypothetical protein
MIGSPLTREKTKFPLLRNRLSFPLQRISFPSHIIPSLAQETVKANPFGCSLRSQPRQPWPTPRYLWVAMGRGATLLSGSESGFPKEEKPVPPSTHFGTFGGANSDSNSILKNKYEFEIPAYSQLIKPMRYQYDFGKNFP